MGLKGYLKVVLGFMCIYLAILGITTMKGHDPDDFEVGIILVGIAVAIPTIALLIQIFQKFREKS